MKKDTSALRIFHEQGRTINSLAIEFGLCRRTVERLIKKQGGIVKSRPQITRDSIPELRNKELLIKLYEEIGSIENLAVHLGTSAETIRKVFKELNIKTLSPVEAMINTRVDIDELEVLKLYEQGLSGNKVAEHFGVSDSAIRRILRQRNTPIRSRTEQILATPKKDQTNAKLASRLRSRLYSALIGKIKKGSAVKDLGCSIEEARIYIESKFYTCPTSNRQMTWNNYGNGGWEIDHIIPLSKLDLTNLEEFKKGCHHTNLQPLWCSENRKKSAKSPL